MKQIKRLGALIVSFAIVLSIIVPASAVSTNDSTVFLKQNTGSTCTLSAAAMMLRRRAILDGSSNWTSITESNLKPTAWVTGQGAKLNYTYNGVSVTTKSLKNFSGSKKEYFISMLSAHPEGIVVYNHSRPHAVLLTDYDTATDTFYCADPSTSAPYGRIKFLDSKIPGDTQDSKVNNIDQIWYIKSGKTIPPVTVVSQNSGEWRVTVPANYKLLCYTNTTDTRNSTYIKAQSGRYVLSCTKSAILSNGKTRYFFVSGDKKSLWFDYDSNHMSVTESPGETSQKQYTVYFDPNGGVVSQTSKTVASGSIVGSMPTPTREGYMFLGWSTSKNTSGLLLKTGNEMIVEKDTTLYAEWKEISNTYTVNFNSNGGTVSTNYKQVTAGKTYGTLPTPVKNGYTFDGWYTALYGGSQITASSPVTGNQTLYAHWIEIRQSKTFTVYFDSNGGMDNRRAKTVVVGEAYGVLPVPARKGYSFEGWYTSAAGGVKIDESAIVNIDSDQTLFAHWSQDVKNFTVVFDANGGRVSQQTKTVMTGSPYGELPTPTYDGFIFLGWFTNKTKITSSTIFDLDRDITLYAQWERESVEPPASTLKVQNIRVTVTDKGMMPTYSVTSNYPINHLSSSFYDPDGYFIMGGNSSFNPDYKIYESNDNGVIYPLYQYMEANRTYSFTIEVGDESGKTVTATATFVMPFSTDRDGKVIP